MHLDNTFSRYVAAGKASCARWVYVVCTPLDAAIRLTMVLTSPSVSRDEEFFNFNQCHV